MMLNILLRNTDISRISTIELNMKWYISLSIFVSSGESAFYPNQVTVFTHQKKKKLSVYCLLFYFQYHDHACILFNVHVYTPTTGQS